MGSRSHWRWYFRRPPLDRRSATDAPRVHGRAPARLRSVRVRTFELRLVAIALTALWFLGALYVVLGYRPGGPIDGLVGAAATLPMAIALAAVFWPPVARGDRAFAGIVWLGLGAGLLLVPSLGGVLNQLLGRGPQTLLPSLESAYPWLLALTATSMFAGLGIARRVLGETAMRRSRLVAGSAIGIAMTLTAGTVFAGAAIANDIALRDSGALSSRFGPPGNGSGEPPPCDGQLAAGASAILDLHLSGDVDGRPVGAVGLTGVRDELDLRWTADVASNVRLGRFGIARIGAAAWSREPPAGWIPAPPSVADDALVDVQILGTALGEGIRTTAENHGVEFVEGARGRHCRVAVDGPTFVAAIPQARWLVGDDTLRRWRGQLDYWVFMDGELGRVTGSVNGPAAALRADGIQGTIRMELDATDRDHPRTILPPTG